MVNKFPANSAYYQTISTPPQSDNEEDFPTTAAMEMEQDQAADEFGQVGGPRISANFFGNKDFELLTEVEKKMVWRFKNLIKILFSSPNKFWPERRRNTSANWSPNCQSITRAFLAVERWPKSTST